MTAKKTLTTFEVRRLIEQLDATWATSPLNPVIQAKAKEQARKLHQWKRGKRTTT